MRTEPGWSGVAAWRAVVIGPVRGDERCLAGARIQKLNYNRYLRLSWAEDLLCASNAVRHLLASDEVRGLFGPCWSSVRVASETSCSACGIARIVSSIVMRLA